MSLRPISVRDAHGQNQRDIEMIAAGGGREAALAGRSGTAVGRHPIAKARRLPDKAALGVLGLQRVPVAAPFSVDEQGKVLPMVSRGNTWPREAEIDRPAGRSLGNEKIGRRTNAIMITLAASVRASPK